ncbi:hypothetical protein [Nonomuraea endophytica]|uniref:Uncharacterized protein n=1 Tax=Nonomuraea endophytica TaxID=714136 RepID=A0A7W8AES2_9ACTN|nr:hypothetical protein [Nonomuraea endophytica]MBB5083825.1 hypothetical protein [Nonomuraea endophytica]
MNEEIAVAWAEFETDIRPGATFTYPRRGRHAAPGLIKSVSLKGKELTGFPAFRHTDPQYTFTTPSAMAGYLLVTAEPPSAGTLGPRYAWCCAIPFERLHGAGYVGLQAVLPPMPPDKGAITLTTPRYELHETVALYKRFRVDWCFDICASLVAEPFRVAIPGADLPWRARLEALDAVTALLPYGVRSGLRATTHGQNPAEPFHLYFTDKVSSTDRVWHPDNDRDWRFRSLRGIFQDCWEDLERHLDKQAAMAFMVAAMRTAPEPVSLTSDGLMTRVQRLLNSSTSPSRALPPPPPARELPDVLGRDPHAVRRMVVDLAPQGAAKIVRLAASGRATGRWGAVPYVLCLAGHTPELDAELRRWLIDQALNVPDDASSAISMTALTPGDPVALLDLVLAALESLTSPPEGLLRTLAAAFSAAWAEPMKRRRAANTAEQERFTEREHRRHARSAWLTERTRRKP